MSDTYQNIARTMINRVVMQDMKSLATYAGLDARTRRKAHLAMSLVQQGVPNADALGFGVLLSPDLNRNLLAIGNGRAQFTFSLEFDVGVTLAADLR